MIRYFLFIIFLIKFLLEIIQISNYYNIYNFEFNEIHTFFKKMNIKFYFIFLFIFNPIVFRWPFIE